MSSPVSRCCTWLAIAVVVVGCRKGEQGNAQGGGGERPPPAVQVVEAITRDVPIYIDEIGRCVASEVVSIQSQAAGRITEIHFTDGADVKKGQMLFTIDPRPYEAALNQEQAALAENAATLSLMKSEFQRVQGLLQTNAISREEFEQRQNGVAVSEAQVEAAKAAIETAKVNLDYCFIKSPIDGRAGQRLVDLGNLVNPQSNQPLLNITRLDPVYVDFTIPEDRLTDVRRYMADHKLTAMAWTPQDPQNVREGELTFLNNLVQSETGTIKLRATLPNSDRHFWPGQFVNVRLVLAVQKNAVMVPVNAEQIGQQGPFVYVVKNGEIEDPKTKQKRAAQVAEMRIIKPGQRHGEMLVIDKGVDPGDQVVTVGHMMVRPGSPVMIAPAAGGPPPPGSPAGPATAPATAPSTKPAE